MITMKLLYFRWSTGRESSGCCLVRASTKDEKMSALHADWIGPGQLPHPGTRKPRIPGTPDSLTFGHPAGTHWRYSHSFWKEKVPRQAGLFFAARLVPGRLVFSTCRPCRRVRELPEQSSARGFRKPWLPL